MAATAVKVKGKCCKDRPRCKKCPVVYKRLSDAGYAERIDKRNYRLLVVPPKKVMKAARAR